MSQLQTQQLSISEDIAHITNYFRREVEKYGNAVGMYTSRAVLLYSMFIP